MAKPHRRRAVTTLTRAYSHDPLERIDSIGGINSDRTRWHMTQAAAITAIGSSTDEFYILADGVQVKIVVLVHRQQKYLKSEREATHPDDLLLQLAR